MTVEEIITGLREMSPADRARVEAELARLGHATDDTPNEQRQPAADPWLRLLNGLGTAGGKCLSEGIDEALYGDRQ